MKKSIANRSINQFIAAVIIVGILCILLFVFSSKAPQVTSKTECGKIIDANYKAGSGIISSGVTQIKTEKMLVTVVGRATVPFGSCSYIVKYSNGYVFFTWDSSGDKGHLIKRGRGGFPTWEEKKTAT